MKAEELKGKVDFGIITIREDEFDAILERFPPEDTVKANSIYNIHSMKLSDDEKYIVATVRCPEQGPNKAQRVATDLIRDLDPEWILLVGIAGGVPDNEFTLGDVVAAMRLHDFSVEAVIENKPSEYANHGGPMHREIEILLANLPAMKQRLGNWNQEVSIGLPRPLVRLNTKNFYGDDEWRKKVKKVMNAHFGKSVQPRLPKVTTAAIASSGKLVKDSITVKQWNHTARDLRGVEMELSGVYEAARQINRTYPVLAIRGISDIVGFNREPEWTIYACHTAAAFTYALLKTKPFRPKLSESSTENNKNSDFIKTERNNYPNSTPTAKLFGLPPRPQYFIGREDDVTELKMRLGVGINKQEILPIQVITAVRGWPGIGKTAMATMLGRDADIATTFTNGILWTSLGQSPKVLYELDVWGRAFDNHDVLSAPTLKDAVRMIANLLHDKRVLLIVDDVWDVEHVVPFIQARGENCKLLITTRVPAVIDALTLSGNAVYNLPGLTEERAVELLRLLAPTVVENYPNECLELVRDVNCLPLALHVAGRLLNSEAKKGWSVNDLLRELKEGAKIIEAKAPTDLMDFEKQTIPTVAALLQKSIERLDSYTRDCFAFLAPFVPKPATFDLDAMKAVWQVADAKPIASVLVDYGLLEPVDGRFQIHALLSAYARSLLT